MVYGDVNTTSWDQPEALEETPELECQHNEDEVEESEDTELVDVSSLLEQGSDLEYQLPKHYHCACHLLNLVSTVDILKANTSD